MLFIRHDFVILLQYIKHFKKGIKNMTLSFQSLAKQHNKISLDEIAQLSLTSIPQLKFLSEFHKGMIEISTSAE